MVLINFTCPWLASCVFSICLFQPNTFLKHFIYFFPLNLSPIRSTASAGEMLWHLKIFKTLKSALKQYITPEIPKLQTYHLACWYQLKPKSASLSSQPNPVMEEQRGDQQGIEEKRDKEESEV